MNAITCLAVISNGKNRSLISDNAKRENQLQEKFNPIREKFTADAMANLLKRFSERGGKNKSMLIYPQPRPSKNLLKISADNFALKYFLPRDFSIFLDILGHIKVIVILRRLFMSPFHSAQTY